MDQQTSPTRRSCRQYWNNLPAHQKREILSRGEWTTFTLLINLPPTCHRGGRHRLSNNEGDNEADDANVGEDNISDNADDADDKADNIDVGEDNISNDANDADDADKEDHWYVTQPPSDNDDDPDHNNDEDLGWQLLQ